MMVIQPIVLECMCGDHLGFSYGTYYLQVTTLAYCKGYLMCNFSYLINATIAIIFELQTTRKLHCSKKKIPFSLCIVALLSVLQNDHATFLLCLLCITSFLGGMWLIAEPILAMFHILLKNCMQNSLLWMEKSTGRMVNRLLYMQSHQKQLFCVCRCHSRLDWVFVVRASDLYFLDCNQMHFVKDKVINSKLIV